MIDLTVNTVFSASTAPEKQKPSIEFDLNFIKEHGIREYIKEMDAVQLEKLRERARAYVLIQRQMDEEELAALEGEMTETAYDLLLEDIEKQTDRMLEEFIEKKIAS